MEGGIKMRFLKKIKERQLQKKVGVCITEYAIFLGFVSLVGIYFRGA